MKDKKYSTRCFLNDEAVNHQTIITKTPFRMSFFGGGTDLKEFFEKDRGAVLSTTFDKYCYFIVQSFPYKNGRCKDLLSRKAWIEARTERRGKPAVYHAMRMLDMQNAEILYRTDLPEYSGLGTSSSFAVGMLNAFYGLKGISVSKKQLANDAIYLERNLCREKGGWQDQIAVSFGGFNRINFYAGEYEVIPLSISPERKRQLNENLMLFFTGLTRYSSNILSANAPEEQNKEEILKEILSLVDDAEKILCNEDISLDNFGYLLDQTWSLKKKTGVAVSNENLDNIYETGTRAGALGGKLLGAGGGGFFLFYVNKDKQNAVRQAMKEYRYIPFKFEEDGAVRISLEEAVDGLSSYMNEEYGDSDLYVY